MGIPAGIMVPHPPLIVPAVGRGEERVIAATVGAYERAAAFVMSFAPETLIVVSPHTAMYADYFHVSPGAGASGNFAQFGAPQEAFDAAYDAEFVRELEAAAKESGFPAGTLGERDKRLDHGVMVPLYFLSRAAGKLPKAVRVGLSGLSLAEHYKFGRLIAETAERLGRRAVVVASGDLSHKLKADGPYGFSPDGPVYDERIMDVMGRAAFDELFDFSEDSCESAAECGHRSFVIMAGAFDGRAVRAERLSYEGPFGVGYGVCTFDGGVRDDSRRFLESYEEKEKARLARIRAAEDEYVRLARASVEHYVRTGRRLEMPDGLPGDMTRRRAGVFVSLHEDGRLRGCIGTIAPVTPCVAREIIDNGVSASSRDPRFNPVEPEELDKLVYSVDVLEPPEKISSPSQLDVKKYGVIVTKGGRRGLLLPNLDGVNSVDEQIAIAKQKAGIAQREEVELERFEVTRHF
ncbi:AmmeMemoRadiSam system protein A [uncultured Cloacibacillus sp.]|uniref:AmmeMemoRadiSam system protein A n=1 Tax=uncultured Cloacibacillus sp. TaxID=889794 RepID=UPI00262538D9|nr:AmmeMemoRadiSam system protein A [uncultured Cloacibacillus sp.]